MDFEVGQALALVGENLSNGDVQKHWNAIQKDGIDYADFCNFISTLPGRVHSGPNRRRPLCLALFKKKLE